MDTHKFFKSYQKFFLLFSLSFAPIFATIISELPRIDVIVTSSYYIWVVRDLFETEYYLIFEIII